MASVTNPPPSKEMPKNYFGLIKFVLKVCGVNIDGNDSTVYRIYSILVIIFVNIVYPALYFLELFKHEYAVVAEDMLMYMFSFFSSSIKSIVLIKKRQKFAKLLNKLEEKPYTPNINRGGKLEEQLIRECIWFVTVQTIAYWAMALGSVTTANTVTIIKRLRNSDYHVLPYGPFTVFNMTYSPNFEISWICQSVCVCYYGMQFTSADLITAAVLAHISYQFKIVQINFRRLLPISYAKMLKETGSVNELSEVNPVDEIDGSVIPWQYLKISLKEAIDYHLAIFSLAQEMENMFNGLLLAVFLSTLGIICFMVYHTSVLSFGDPKIWNPAVELICAGLQVATICYWGEQVLFQSEEVGKAAYESNFVGTDLRFQKSLALVIRRSQYPTQITAWKFSAIAMPTFAWIFRTSYSAFMMLRHMHD